jgi:hypothetical protein
MRIDERFSWLMSFRLAVEVYLRAWKVFFRIVAYLS